MAQIIHIPFLIKYYYTMRHLLLFLFCFSCISANAQSDSLTLFNAKQLILPASLITIGTYGINNGWFCSIKNELRNDMENWRGVSRFHADDYLQYVPVAANLGLDFLGVESKHNFKERVVVSATSFLAMTAMVRGIKIISNEKRPDSDATNSFPSGHTATAFMGAELVRLEYGNAYGLGAYTVASCIAFLRIYNDRHWLNDVIAGAGFGILSAKIGYWLLPLNKKVFKLNNRNSYSILPTYDGYSRSFGLSMTIY